MREDEKGNNSGKPVPLMIRIYKLYPNQTPDEAYADHIRVLRMVDNVTNNLNVYEVIDLKQRDKPPMSMYLKHDRPHVYCGAGVIFSKT